MKHWITKYWKPVIFTTAFLICISFFVNLLAIGSSYSDGVDAQAAERAYNYALEQSLRIRDQYDALKTTTEWYATELGLCADGAETVGYLQTIRLDLHEKNPDFRDIFYFRDGVLYDLNDRAVTGYPALTELGSAEGSAVSRVFQYENLLMSFGVSAPVEGGSIDRLVLLFDRIAVSLDNFMYHTQQDGSRGLIDSVSSAEFLLFCKSDGVILERQVNSEEYFSPGNESVRSGILKQLFQSGTEYDEVLSSTAGESIRTFPIRTDTGRFVLTVTSFGAGNGGGFLLGLYNMENLYGSGHSLMDSMWETLVLLGVILLLFAVMFVTDQIRVNRKISRLTTMNEELDCLTQNGFESVARDLIDANRTSRYAIVMMQVNNFGYIAEKFGETQSKETLKYLRGICQKAMILAETYAYMRDGKFLLLLHYKDRKALVERLNGLYWQAAQYRIQPDSEYKINLTYSIYELEQGEESEPVHRMIDKALMVEANSSVQRGTVSFSFYGDMLRENYLRRAEIEGRMQNALESNEFHLFYQPKYNLKKGTLDGSEILVRWFDEKIDHYRQPGEFIPVFEENGFINKLDRFVFYRACENIAGRIREKQTAYPVSVNVSRVTAIQPDFLDYYIRIKNKFGIRDGFVTLEFTESFAYENYEYLAGIIEKLHAAGFLCSLDDFGTGYSSFSVLKTLDMDEIKIDKSFLDKGDRPERDRILLESIIDMIRKLGIKITQEGVETKEEFTMLEEMDCDVVQGYYFAKPMKYVDYREFVQMNFGK